MIENIEWRRFIQIKDRFSIKHEIKKRSPHITDLVNLVQTHIRITYSTQKFWLLPKTRTIDELKYSTSMAEWETEKQKKTQ